MYKVDEHQNESFSSLYLFIYFYLFVIYLKSWSKNVTIVYDKTNKIQLRQEVKMLNTHFKTVYTPISHHSKGLLWGKSTLVEEKERKSKSSIGYKHLETCILRWAII